MLFPHLPSGNSIPPAALCKNLESRLSSLFFLHPTCHPSENPIQFTSDIYPESNHFSPSRLPPPFTKALLLLSWVTVTTCYLPSPPYSPHSNQSDPYKKNLYAIFIKIQITPGWCSMRQWRAILIKGQIKVLAWSLRPMTQPCFLYDLISCPLCSAHTLLPGCFWSTPHILALRTLHLLFLSTRILFFLQVSVKFIQNSSQVSPFQTEAFIDYPK